MTDSVSPPPGSDAPGGDVVDALAERASRTSLESIGSLPTPVQATPAALNGLHIEDAVDHQLDDSERERSTAAELEQVRKEKAQLEENYNNLLSRLTTMRSTLGGKLKQDADELDQRAQRIATLQAANEDLNFTVETLRTELIASNDDLEAAHRELEAARTRAADAQREAQDDSGLRESALRDAQEDLERVRAEREAWEVEAGRERVAREDALQAHQALERELGALRIERDALRSDRDAEAESARNLHNVLEEFQAAKDRELRETLGDLQSQLQTTTKALADQKQRADEAQRELEAIQANFESSLVLQQEVKEKNLLIGKLKHEAVILNEHLTEALRRLKKDNTENNVDRRLITNVLISFFNTPRADAKRFEMLSLLASILSWSDEDRERAGLQRAGSSGLAPPHTSPASTRSGRPRGHSRASHVGAAKEAERDGLGENETFSNLWIEFLLKEANQSPSSASSQQPNAFLLPSSAQSPPATVRPGSRLPEIPGSPTSPSPASGRRPSISSAVSGTTAASSLAPFSRAPSEAPDRK